MGFAKPIETNFDSKSGIWTAYAEYDGNKYISESDDEKESRHAVISLIANRLVFGSQDEARKFDDN